LIEQLGAGDHVITNSDDNILPFMAQADLMISDISTACYEWFHFDKPIVFANPAPNKYQPSDNIGSNTYAWQAGDVINAEDDILRLVNQNIEDDSYRDIRNRIFNYTVFKPDGNASQRQAEAIIEFYNRYENTNYWWLIFSSYVFRRFRRQVSKIVNKYYQRYKKDRVGK
jgi:CDP-glycerol glycerophosphotransferase (TagB/SpsB family)